MSDLSEVARQKLRDEMNLYADELATGSPANWEEYKRMVGVIAGMAIAERILLDLEALEREAD